MKKIFNSKVAFFIFGFILGLIVIIILNKINFNNSENEYYKLESDYCIDNVGVLKIGTLLKTDKGMSEGFTRYILYLNISDGEVLENYPTKEKNMIMPYWLIPIDSTCLNEK
ncbi:MAG: hypothetical protein KKF98_08515 [Bacteroidetes bacterium]|nr:hypothetical protein [Bacteroidota bacterium]